MNLFVADPHWGWWIILYFFLGGIAAGAYFLSAMIELVGRERDPSVARAGYRIAFPLIVVCAVLLIVDLDHPGRFWHMLFNPEVVHPALDAGWPWSSAGWKLMTNAPHVKPWSPMSIGSWVISLFGLCSFLCFVGTFRPEGRIARLLNSRSVGHPIRIVGCAVGFFVAAYTGALLTATNQPLWSDSVWIASLFLASATSTGIAALLLFCQSTNVATRNRLKLVDLWALKLELVVFGIFLASLGVQLLPILQTSSGRLLIVGTLVLGLVIPLGIHLWWGTSGRRAIVTAALFVLVGGFVLRYAILTTPPELLGSRPSTRFDPSLIRIGPETGRQRHAGPAADPGTRPAPRSKVYY